MNTHMAGELTSERRHPLADLLKGTRVILGSQSPRRVELLGQLGIPFEVHPSRAPEDHLPEVKPSQLPLLLAKRKADYLLQHLEHSDLLITADTVVVQEGRVIEKPQSIEEARGFLQRLSGVWHEVVTGYCLTTTSHQFSETITTEVRFAPLFPDEIDYYLSHYEVLDKAGAYGIQDWIGLIGVSEIRGSYHNVMGLPTAALYRHLKDFLVSLQ